MEAGLGMSEQFYSWAISVFNIGAVIGALLNGILSKFLPYWYLVLSSLIMHTLGYVLYAIATSGWHIILSKFLSGLFVGAESTLGFAYISESNADYQAAIIELGEDDKKATRVKHTLFALQSLGSNIGYILGPGMYYSFINPRRACAERVTVVVSCVCLSVCMSVRTRYSGSTRS